MKMIKAEARGKLTFKGSAIDPYIFEGLALKIYLVILK